MRRRSNRDFYVPPFIGAVRRRGRQECSGVSELNRRAARAWTPSAPRTISWDVLGSSDSKLLEAARSCGVRRHSSLCRWLSSSTVASRRVTQTAAAANTRQTADGPLHLNPPNPCSRAVLTICLVLDFFFYTLATAECRQRFRQHTAQYIMGMLHMHLYSHKLQIQKL